MAEHSTKGDVLEQAIVAGEEVRIEVAGLVIVARRCDDWPRVPVNVLVSNAETAIYGQGPDLKQALLDFDGACQEMWNLSGNVPLSPELRRRMDCLAQWIKPNG